MATERTGHDRSFAAPTTGCLGPPRAYLRAPRRPSVVAGTAGPSTHRCDQRRTGVHRRRVKTVEFADPGGALTGRRMGWDSARKVLQRFPGFAPSHGEPVGHSGPRLLGATMQHVA